MNLTFLLLATNTLAGFEEEFERINRLELNVVGRDYKLQQYFKLVQDFPEEPTRSRAMINIANLLSIKDTERGFSPSQKEALKWYRDAASAATVGSKDWFDAKWILLDKDTPDMHSSHLADIESHANGDSLVLAKCELKRFEVDLKSEQIESAETRMRTLSRWYSDRDRIPEDLDKKFELDHIIREPINIMLDWYSKTPLPPEVCLQKLDSLRDLAPDDRVVHANYKRAVEWANTRTTAKGTYRLLEVTPSNSGSPLIEK